MPATDRILAGTPTSQFAIGAEDGEDWELLSRVSGVAFDANENLYVLDAGNNRVLVFDANGKFLRKIGKKGGGPGELLSPVGLAFTHDGYVAVTDLGRPGISLFRPDGSFVKNLMMGDSLGFPALQGGTLAHPKAGVVVRSTAILFGAGGPPRNGAPPALPRTSPVTWLSAHAAPTRLYSIPLPAVNRRVSNSGTASNQRVSVRVATPAFQPPSLWTVLSDGSVAVATDANYRVNIAANGKVRRVIERPITARKVTEHDKDRARDLRRKQMKSGAGAITVRVENGPGGAQRSMSAGAGGPRPSDADIEQTLREMTFLETVPVLQRMSVDPKGRLWIERTGREYGADGPIDIIAPTGQYVGTINGKMPDAISPSGRAAYIERDDMDIEKVVVRRLPAAWR